MCSGQNMHIFIFAQRLDLVVGNNETDIFVGFSNSGTLPHLSLLASSRRPGFMGR